MTMHDHPSVNGMGAFEGLKSGLLMQQRAARLAKLAIADLDDATFAAVVSEAIRARKWIVAQQIINEVQK